MPFALDFLLPFVEDFWGNGVFRVPPLRGLQRRGIFALWRRRIRVLIAIYLVLLVAVAWYMYLRKITNASHRETADATTLISAAEQSPFHVNDMKLLRQFPFQINPYLPLSYWLYGLGQSPHDVRFVRARLISLVFVAGTCLFAYLIGRKLGASKISAVVAANVAFIGSSVVAFFAHCIRPDLLAVGFLAAAFYCYLLHVAAPRPRFIGRWFCLTMLLATAAMAVKLYPWVSIMMFGLVAVWRRRWEEVLAWAVWACGMTATLIAWNYWSGGGFLQHVVLSQKNLTQFLPLQHDFECVAPGITAPEYALILGWAIYVIFEKWRRPLDETATAESSAAPAPQFLMATYVLLAALEPIPLMMKWGSNSYYYYELVFATAITVSVLISQPMSIVPRFRMQNVSHIVGLLMVAIFAVGMTARASASFASSRYARAFSGGIAKVEPLDRLAQPALPQSDCAVPIIPMNEVKLRQRFHGKLVIASHDYMHALANAGATIAVNDPAFFNVQFVVGNLDEQVAAAFCDGIDRHEVDYLVLPIALNDWFDSRPSSFRGALNNQFSLYYFRAFLTSRFKLDYLMVGSEQEVWYVYRNTAGQKTATAP